MSGVIKMLSVSSTPNTGTKQLNIKIGTRDSALAMLQTNHVKAELQQQFPHIFCSIESMKTLGDKVLDVALSKIGSKSLFTKELEDALDQHFVQIVVHSLKDLPTTLPPGMAIGAILKREDPRDAIIMNPKNSNKTLDQLPAGSVIGSSSVRRVAQLSRRYPGLVFESVRGNLNTRLRKLEEGDTYSALVLAAAGIHRMGWKEKVAQYLEPSECLYAVGQGALAVECLAADTPTLSVLHRLCHAPTLLAAVAERTFMAALEGGCSAPVAVTTAVTDKSITLKGGVWSLDGGVQLIEELTAQLPECTDGGSPGGPATTQSQQQDTSNGNNVEELNGSSSNGSTPTDCSNGNVVSGSGSAVSRSSGSNGVATRRVGAGGVNDSNGNSDTVGQLNRRGSANQSQFEHSPKKRKYSSEEGESVTNKSSEVQGETCCGGSSESFVGIIPPPWLVAKASVAHKLGRDLAEILLSKGAGKILADAKALNTVTAPNVKPAQKPSN